MMLREPELSDAPALGRLHAEAWHVGYRGLMPAELLAGVTVEGRTAMWEQILSPERQERQRADARGARERIVVVADDVDEVAVGFAWTGYCRDEDVPEGTGELYAINVAPSRWGNGTGRLLLGYAHARLMITGFDHAVLWVLPGNVRARRLYERFGWGADGVTREEEDGGFPIPEMRYARKLER